MAAGAKQQAQPQLIFVDGSFQELAREMADYLHIADEIKPIVDNEAKKEEVLTKLVRSSAALTSVPEKEFTAASNLMVHLVLQSEEPKNHLPALCQAFSKPIASSPVNGVGLSLNALSTVFNLIAPENPIRYNVFMAILRFLKANSMFDTIQPYLKHLPAWFEDWATSEEYQRQMYEEVAEVAKEAGKEE